MPPDQPSPDAVKPGALSALLEALVRAPQEGGTWSRGLRPGDLVGRFEILRELGRGGFGIVYEARDRELGRSVAFKAVLAGEHAAAREERLLREAESAARLSHPNIVTLHDVGRCEHGPFLVLELLRGQTLADRLEQGPVSLREAVRIGRLVAEGLAHAHRHGVVHRDLTPGNVFLCEDGQVKVLDFGLAHAFGQVRAAGGTPAYMAPEQWRQAPEDERTDVFALGVMLHRLLSGRLPFPEGDGGKAAAGSRPAPALESAEAPALGPLVARMLAKDPVDRPRDGGEVLAALASLEAELTRTPSTPSAPVRTRDPGARRLLAWAAAGLALVLVTAAVGVWRLRAGSAAAVAPVAVAVADFANLTGEPELDGLSGMLITSLEQSRRLTVLTRVRMLDLLRQLGKGDVPVVDEPLGREVALSAGARALVLATIRRFDHLYAIEVKVLDPATSQYVFTLKQEGEGKKSVPGMIDRLSEQVRERLRVETPAEVQATSVKVADATTASFEAYQHYFRGDQLKEAIRYEAAIAEYRKALAIDPTFALPRYRIAYLGEFMAMPKAEQKAEMAEALRHVDRVPHKERLLFQAWMAHLDGRDADAHGLYAAVTEAYAQDKEAQFMAGDLHLHAGDVAQGLPYFERAVALDPTWEPALMHLTDSLAELGRDQDLMRVSRGWVERAPSASAYRALAMAQKAAGQRGQAVEAARRALDLDGTAVSRSVLATMLVAAERFDEAEALLAPATRPTASLVDRSWSALSLAEAVAYQGRHREALRLVDSYPSDPGAPLDKRRAFRLLLLLGRPEAGPALAEARALAAGQKAGDDWKLLPAVLELLGDPAAAAPLAANLAPSGQERRLYDAVRAWRGGSHEAALASLRTLSGERSMEAGPLATWLLATVALEAGRDREALEALARVKAGDGALWQAWAYPRSLYLTASIHERLGNTAEARAALEHLFRLWRRPDADLPYLAEARALRRRLTAGG